MIALDINFISAKQVLKKNTIAKHSFSMQAYLCSVLVKDHKAYATSWPF